MPILRETKYLKLMQNNIEKKKKKTVIIGPDTRDLQLIM